MLGTYISVMGPLVLPCVGIGGLENVWHWLISGCTFAVFTHPMMIWLRVWLWLEKPSEFKLESESLLPEDGQADSDDPSTYTLMGAGPGTAGD